MSSSNRNLFEEYSNSENLIIKKPNAENTILTIDNLNEFKEKIKYIDSAILPNINNGKEKL